MKKVKYVLFLFMVIALTACNDMTYSEALDICQRCGWTGTNGLAPGYNRPQGVVYCTRTRDSNSESMPIKDVMAECGIYPRPGE